MLKYSSQPINHRKVVAWALFAAFLGIFLPVLPSYAQAPFTQPDSSFSGSITLDQPEPVYPGTRAMLSGRGFKPGQHVILERGATALNPLPVVASEDGSFQVGVDVPVDAAIGFQPVVVKASSPDAALIFNLKISPQIPLMNQEQYELQSLRFDLGVFQVAYSSANDALFVSTAKVTRPPVQDSALLRIDPQTMAIVATYKPQIANERTGLRAAFGLGIDDQHQTLWVTNSRQSTLSIHDQLTLQPLKQFELGIVTNPRDVLVDAQSERAYVSSQDVAHIAVFNTQTQDLMTTLEIQTTQRGPGRASFRPMTLALNTQTYQLYTVSYDTSEIAVINTQKLEVERVMVLPGVIQAAGVAVDAKRGMVYVAAQGSDDLLIVNIQTGEITKQVFIGAAPMNVIYEPVNDLIYVANRGSGTLVILSPEGEIIANLPIGTYPNHLVADRRGNVYVTSLGRTGDESHPAMLTRVICRGSGQ